MKHFITALLIPLFIAKLSAQADTIPPVLTCLNGIIVPVGYECFTPIYATDFVDFANSDVSTGNVQLRIRETCTGTGFPEDLPYINASICSKAFEIWARDEAGNTSSCVSTIIVQDLGYCDVGYGYALLTNMPNERGIPKTKVTIDAFNSCLGDSIHLELSSVLLSNGYWQEGAGCTNFSCNIAPIGYTTMMVPSKTDDYNNGLTTYDLVLIYKHILGITPLNSPYKILAADANLDNQVNMDDLVLIKKWIQGTNGQQKGPCWRYVPKYFVFPDPQHPFSSPFPEKIALSNIHDPNVEWFSYDFIGVKLGDVNYSVDTNN
jgi:hypothetical protein